MASSFIIKNADGKFWAGGVSFSPEYPDARHFNTISMAKMTASALAKRCLTDMHVIRNYGYETQETVYTKSW